MGRRIGRPQQGKSWAAGKERKKVPAERDNAHDQQARIGKCREEGSCAKRAWGSLDLKNLKFDVRVLPLNLFS